MPELPEVEVVRSGLARWASGRRVNAVEVRDTRSLRRQQGGPDLFATQLTGLRLSAAVRRGKYLWFELTTPDGSPFAVDGLEQVLLAHLGMSGQMLMEEPEAPDEKHLKVRLSLSPAEGMPAQLRFIDQRIFGGLSVTSVVPTGDGLPGGLGTERALLPVEVSRIARDVLDPAFDVDALHAVFRKKRVAVKRAILDQNLISGIGNIYADEALWAAEIHGEKPVNTLRKSDTVRLFEAAHEVMTRALEAGGTSFDSLYVNVNGASGYFSRYLHSYGRTGEPCGRCGTSIVRERFMNRSSHFCPTCQPAPDLST